MGADMWGELEQMESKTEKPLVALTAEIVSAYVRNNPVVANDLLALIGDVHQALSRASVDAAAAEAEERAARDKQADREARESRRYDDNGAWGRTPTTRRSSSRPDSIVETFGKSFARQLGSRAGQAIIRGVLGGLFKSR